MSHLNTDYSTTEKNNSEGVRGCRIVLKQALKVNNHLFAPTPTYFVHLNS